MYLFKASSPNLSVLFATVSRFLFQESIFLFYYVGLLCHSVLYLEWQLVECSQNVKKTKAQREKVACI